MSDIWLVLRISHGGRVTATKWNQGLADQAGDDGIDSLAGIRFDFAPRPSRKTTSEVLALLHEIAHGEAWIERSGSRHWRIDLARLSGVHPVIRDLSYPQLRLDVLPSVETREVSNQHGAHFVFSVTFEIGEVLYSSLVPNEIHDSLRRFRYEHPDPRRVGFLMMRFGASEAFSAAHLAIRETLQGHGLTCVRADDREYHQDLYWNIMTYLYGSGFGVALFERVESDYFNPNVSFEVGYSFALGNPVCLLKERTLPSLQTDLVGRLYRSFDRDSPNDSIDRSLTAWLRDRDIL